MTYTAEFERQYFLRTRFLRVIYLLGLSKYVHLSHFMIRHRRVPNFPKTRYLNDYLYEVKAKQKPSVLQELTSDKELMKVFVRGALGEDLCVPTLAVLKSPADIDAFRVNERCVAKPTHMSGQVLYLDRDPGQDEKSLMKEWLRTNFADYALEENYRRLEKKIIIEPVIDFLQEQRVDYKIYCHDGKARMIDLIKGHPGPRQFSFFTPTWNQIRLSLPTAPYMPDETPRPDNLDQMVAIAEKLSGYFEAVRVDLYTDGHSRILVGELTHCPGNAGSVCDPVETERYFVDGAPDHEVSS